MGNTAWPFQTLFLWQLKGNIINSRRYCSEQEPRPIETNLTLIHNTEEHFNRHKSAFAVIVLLSYQKLTFGIFQKDECPFSLPIWMPFHLGQCLFDLVFMSDMGIELWWKWKIFYLTFGFSETGLISWQKKIWKDRLPVWRANRSS